MHWNGVKGLGTALSTFAWAEAAATAPATCLAGSLGDSSNKAWLQDLAGAMTGEGVHGALPDVDGPAPGLRILYPTNATAFQCALWRRGKGGRVCVW